MSARVQAELVWGKLAVRRRNAARAPLQQGGVPVWPAADGRPTREWRHVVQARRGRICRSTRMPLRGRRRLCRLVVDDSPRSRALTRDSSQQQDEGGPITVTDVGDPVAGAKVRVAGRTSTSDAAGHTTVTNVAAGATVSVTAAGYRPGSTTLESPRGDLDMRRPSGTNIVVIISVVVVAAGVARASIPAANGTICAVLASRRSRIGAVLKSLYVIDDTERCWMARPSSPGTNPGRSERRGRKDPLGHPEPQGARNSSTGRTGPMSLCPEGRRSLRAFRTRASS